MFRRRSILIVLLLASGLVVGILAGRGFMAGRFQTAEAGSASEGSAEVDLRRFRDPEAGFALSYPASWTPHRADDPQVRLLASGPSGGSLLVRVVDLGTPVRADDVKALRGMTEEIVTSGDGVRIVSGPREIELSGMRGFHYLYRFPEAASGSRGVHSHYFVFEGRRMYTLVLQAVPGEAFEGLAETFDAVAGSFAASPE